MFIANYTLQSTVPTNQHRIYPMYVPCYRPIAYVHMYTVSQKKLGDFFTAYNFRNIKQIFTKFGTNNALFILSIMP